MKTISGRRFRPQHFALRAVLAFCLSALLLCSASFCSEAEAAGDNASRLDAIRDQMDRGQGLFLAQKYGEAAAVFEDGYKTYPYSAFLFNAGVCYQKLDQADKALDAFGRYLQSDPHAPDAGAVRERVSAIEAALAAAKTAAASAPPNGGPEAPDSVKLPDDTTGMKSLVIVETDPEGAPIKVYRRVDDQAANYADGTKNTGWKLVAEQKSPLNLTLDVGRYHVVVEKYQDFNQSEADIDVAPGHVHHFQANLSQGEFMGFVEIASNVKGASIYLDGSRETIWGETPHGALISPGPHKFVVEAPGYTTVELEAEIKTGDRQILEVELKRVKFGVLRLDADIAEVTVSVDQKPAGVWSRGQSALEVQLPAGKHDLLVSADGYKQLRKSVTIPEGQILPVRAKMIKKYPRTTAWTQAILSAGFLGAGVYLGVESNRLDKELKADQQAGYLNGSDSRLNRGLWYSVGANSAFAVGGVLGIFSIYNFIKDPYPDPVLYQGKQSDFTTMRQPLPTGPTAAPASGAYFPWKIEFAGAPQGGTN